jgi:hypothetical protein
VSAVNLFLTPTPISALSSLDLLGFMDSGQIFAIVFGTVMCLVLACAFVHAIARHIGISFNVFCLKIRITPRNRPSRILLPPLANIQLSPLSPLSAGRPSSTNSFHSPFTSTPPPYSPHCMFLFLFCFLYSYILSFQLIIPTILLLLLSCLLMVLFVRDFVDICFYFILLFFSSADDPADDQKDSDLTPTPAITSTIPLQGVNDDVSDACMYSVLFSFPCC